MADMHLQGKVTMDAKQGETALKSTAAASREVTKSVKGIGGAAAATDAQIAALKGELAQVKSQLQAMGAANVQAAQNMGQLQTEADHLKSKLGGVGKSGQASAGQVGNLAAQFNDIGVMMAAGQNPLQLAIQQGTQIGQVIGPMGAAGAVKSLKAAFMTMLSPVNLVTIGAIALGAALVNWLSKSGEEAKSLEDQLSDLNDSIDALDKASAGLGEDGLEDARTRYGQLTTAVREMIEAKRALAREEARQELAAARGSIRSAASELLQTDRLDDGGHRERNAYARLQRQLGLTRAEADQLHDALEAGANATGPAQQAAAYRQVYALITQATGGVSELSDEQRKFLTDLIGAEEAARRMAALDVSSNIVSAASGATRLADALKDARDAVRDLQSQGRIDFADAELALQHRNDPVELARQRGIREMIAEQAPMRDGADQAQLVMLDAQAVAYGELQAKIARLNQTRSAEARAAQGAASAEKQRRETVSRAIDLERNRIALAGAATETERELIRNSAALGAATDQERAALEALIATRMQAETQADQRDAISGLIASQQAELDLLRETDPVQKEMLRNREALQGATQAERDAVQKLIQTRQSEAAAIERTQEQRQAFEDASYQAIKGLILQGQSLADVFDNLALSIADAALQAALLGTGPFGGVTGGGLLTNLSSAIFGGGASAPIPAAASGGYLTGAGSGTDDKILMYGSPGEYMVNAQATKRYRHELELMNAGGIPRFARGGAIDGSAANASGPLVVVEDHTSGRVTRSTRETTDAQGRRQTRLVLADAVGDALTQPGGGAKRRLSQLGLPEEGARR